MSSRPPAKPRLCFGLSRTHVATDETALESLCRLLGDATGTEVVWKSAADYDELLSDLPRGEVHVAWLPPILALRAAAAGNVQPIVLPVRHGASSYHTALFCRDDAPYQSTDDLDGVRAAWVHRQSASGYLIIRALLRSQDVDLDKAFGEDQFLGSHEAVTSAVVEGRADVGASFMNLSHAAPAPGEPSPRSTGWGDAPVRVLAQAGPCASDVIAANSLLPTALAEALAAAMLDEDNEELRQALTTVLDAEGVVAPADEHLDALRNLISWVEHDARHEQR
jgi:phosphonate transport system substrate-binding protein